MLLIFDSTSPFDKDERADFERTLLSLDDER